LGAPAREMLQAIGARFHSELTKLRTKGGGKGKAGNESGGELRPKIGKKSLDSVGKRVLEQ